MTKKGQRITVCRNVERCHQNNESSSVPDKKPWHTIGDIPQRLASNLHPNCQQISAPIIPLPMAGPPCYKSRALSFNPGSGSVCRLSK
ncbi:hypothetical protein RRG08_023666 [Elysia crispata]|uniref:Uncharacterized protein n=1 Tax=Elysia crispata TaxID=231223 RepID=A0AAE0XSC7_9GAST|nr:hypothetical protein RRG08_023666 [Elysia crispata]